MLLESMTRSHEDYVEAAENILTPSQTEKLKAYLDQEREVMISGMKMSALEYGHSYDPEGGADSQE